VALLSDLKGFLLEETVSGGQFSDGLDCVAFEEVGGRDGEPGRQSLKDLLSDSLVLGQLSL